MYRFYQRRKASSHNNTMKKVFIRLIILCIAIYAVYTFILQQRLLNSYASEKKEFVKEIEAAQEKKEELTSTLDHLNSTEYIEDVARNKLDMYLPNERVYIDITQ